MNDIILVPVELSAGPDQIQPAEVAFQKNNSNRELPEKKTVETVPEIPIRQWIMPPEQQGYIQANDRDCL